MYQSMIKKILLLALSGFFLAVVAVAFHHHDNAFLLKSCSICKVKTSISGTMSKKQLNSVPAMTAVSLGLAAVYPLWAPIAHKDTIIFISSHAGYLCPNKAPPAKS